MFRSTRTALLSVCLVCVASHAFGFSSDAMDEALATLATRLVHPSQWPAECNEWMLNLSDVPGGVHVRPHESAVSAVRRALFTFHDPIVSQVRHAVEKADQDSQRAAAASIREVLSGLFDGPDTSALLSTSLVHALVRRIWQMYAITGCRWGTAGFTMPNGVPVSFYAADDLHSKMSAILTLMGEHGATNLEDEVAFTRAVMGIQPEALRSSVQTVLRVELTAPAESSSPPPWEMSIPDLLRTCDSTLGRGHKGAGTVAEHIDPDRVPLVTSVCMVLYVLERRVHSPGTVFATLLPHDNDPRPPEPEPRWELAHERLHRVAALGRRIYGTTRLTNRWWAALARRVTGEVSTHMMSEDVVFEYSIDYGLLSAGGRAELAAGTGSSGELVDDTLCYREAFREALGVLAPHYQYPPKGMIATNSLAISVDGLQSITHPTLPAAQWQDVSSRYADSLVENGVVVLDSRVPAGDVTRMLMSIAQMKPENTRGAVNMYDLTAMVRDEPDTEMVIWGSNGLDGSPGFFMEHVKGAQAIAADPVILATVESYFGMAGRLAAVQAFMTYGDTKSDELEAQVRGSACQWHRDHDDLVMLKVFVYLTDVDAHDGPHKFATRSHRCHRRHMFGSSMASTRTSEEHVAASHDIRTLTGLKGTVIIEDTSGWHIGGSHTRPDSVRMVLALMYVAPGIGDAGPWQLPEKAMTPSLVAAVRHYPSWFTFNSDMRT